MKTKPCLAAAALFVTACETPVPSSAPSRHGSRYAYGTTVTDTTPLPAAASVSASVSTGPTARPAAANHSSSLPPPDAEVLYQRRESDIFGSSTYTSRTQVRGPVVEEIHIGNQRVLPQPGYVPAGTTLIYDPVTGRAIPVRRH